LHAQILNRLIQHRQFAGSQNPCHRNYNQQGRGFCSWRRENG